MRLSVRPVLRPCSLTTTRDVAAFRCCTTIAQPAKLSNKLTMEKNINTTLTKTWEKLLHDPIEYVDVGSNLSGSTRLPPSRPVKIGKRWMEYQGIENWDGLLDPLDENLRGEIIRYGKFVDATYQAFDFDPSSPSYATCRFPKSSLLDRSGIPDTGYRITKNLRATSGIRLPRWTEKVPSWISTQSSWIGYVAVCQNKEEIARLGRRDVVIALRGTVTCLEWLENLRATLTNLPNADGAVGDTCKCSDGCRPMVESGFLSLYTSGTKNSLSLQQMVRKEIARLLESYGDEPLSFTITGHSLGAALATLAANDIKTTFKNRNPLVTVVSFGGPRVGNCSFRLGLEEQGTKVLRIVNSDDVITKVPGFVIDHNDDLAAKGDANVSGLLPSWIQKRVENTKWMYAEVGRELRLRSRDSPYLMDSMNVATCHDLSTYLHLVEGFVSSTCPFRVTAKRMLSSHCKKKLRSKMPG